MNTFDLFRFSQPRFRNDPAYFFRSVLSFEPDPWQLRAASDLAFNPFVSIRSGQGVGKTAFEAASLLWFLSCFPFSRVVATAPTRRQLSDVLWPEAAKWISRSPLLSETLLWSKTHISVKHHEHLWFAAARTAAKPENMQGFHADNLLFIVDEASGVPDDIFEAIFGSLSGDNNKLLLCGNPTRASGSFFDSHNADRALFKTHTVSALDSPRTNPALTQSLIHKFGRDSNVVRVRVLGDFPLSDDDVFIPLSIIENNLYSSFDPAPPLTLDIGVDVARFGDDFTVIARKAGSFILPLSVRSGADTSATAEETVALARALLSDFPSFSGKLFIKVDDTGVGGGVTDAINKILRLDPSLHRLAVVPVNFAARVSHPYFSDFNTFLWGNFKDLLDNNLISIPDDPLLIAQLSTRKKSFSPNGKIKIEPKLDMKKRGLPSPDRADAAALAALPHFFDSAALFRKEGSRRP